MPVEGPVLLDIETLQGFQTPVPLPTLTLEKYRTFELVWNWGSASTLNWLCARDCYVVAISVISGSAQARWGLYDPVPVIPSGSVSDRFDLLDFNSFANLSGICWAVKGGQRIYGTSTAAITLVWHRIFPGPGIPED